jgi:beta-lactamase regulating signal transducer with metallopeptidase domain
MLRTSSSVSTRALEARILRLIDERPALALLRRRIVASEWAEAPIATVGIFAPRILVQTAFASALDDEALAGALHHELEHFVGRDPLKYFVAWWALAVNPLGRFQLRGEHARWLLEREAHCDRQAVASGASAAALAEALLVAARSGRSSAFQAPLGSSHLDAVRLRLGLLLAYADRTPHRCGSDRGVPLLLAALAVAAAIPHAGGTHLLDWVHLASEGAVSLVAGD